MHRASVLKQLRELLPADRAIPIDEAKAIAERQANRLLHLLGITEPSVNIAKLIDLPHIRVRVMSPLPVSGMTYWNKTHWDIAVRKGDSSTRRRFTLAHEFKHIIDHPHIDTLYPDLNVSATTGKRVEAICDYFAACLLMPALWVQREWERGVHDAAVLARIFKVSPAAMKIRLAYLNLGGVPNKPVKESDGDVRGYFRMLPMPAMATVAIDVAAEPCPFMQFLADRLS